MAQRLTTMYYRPDVNPEEPMTFENRRGQRQQEYRLLWRYYQNSVFERLANGYSWYNYKRVYGLYRATRSLYNPATRLVNFYARKVYPGMLPLSDDPLPPGYSSAIPFNEGMDKKLQNAIRQIWQWTNWQNGKMIMVKFGAAVGDVLVEVIDDIGRGKVFFNIVFPGFVPNVVLDIAGNVQEYTVEYPTRDKDGTVYTYKKVVDKVRIREFKNGIPFNYGRGQEYPNEYGFVPAVWIRHNDVGRVWGGCAFQASIGKFDELNSIASHVNDQIHRVIAAPIVLWTESRLTDALPAPEPNRTPSDYEYEGDGVDRDDLLILRGLPGGKVDHLTGDLNIADALAAMKDLRTEIEQDFPELVMYPELRGMTQITGPAAQKLVGDVEANLLEAAANYDAASIKMFQMGVAIAGQRLKDGSWKDAGVEITDQQKAFQGFDLESYAKGDLNFWIVPRPLIPLSEAEKLEGEQAKVNLELMKLKLTQAKANPEGLSGTEGVDGTPASTAHNVNQQQDKKVPEAKPKDESKNTNPNG